MTLTPIPQIALIILFASGSDDRILPESKGVPPATVLSVSATAAAHEVGLSGNRLADRHSVARFVAPLGPAPKVHLTAEQIAEVAGGIRAGASGDVLIVDCHGNYDHDTIQGAIDAASDGDVVIVLPNTCTPEGHYFENLDFLGKAIVVQSLDPENSDIVAATILNGSSNDLSEKPKPPAPDCRVGQCLLRLLKD